MGELTFSVIILVYRNLKRPESANSEEQDVRFMLEAWTMANKSEDKQTKVSNRSTGLLK